MHAAGAQAAACPICRQSLDFISKDAQYDEMVSVVVAALEQRSDVPFRDPPKERADTIEVDFGVGTGSAGVCLQTVQGPGVRISKVLKSGRFYNGGFRPDDIILEVNGVPCSEVETAVSHINREQARQGKLTLRVLRECDKRCARVTFRELELPRKPKVAPTGTAKCVAANEHQADPGVWLEC
jgi:S1-C subfamily serine protease